MNIKFKKKKEFNGFPNIQFPHQMKRNEVFCMENIVFIKLYKAK